ncbi:Na/Pi cotransporter family protein [Malonomonas rubra]|uniref:Na/Pi cotransporter family protein n=1 Tax=Malonomonas rubra TaxID=57040 RepID=UPI0026ED125D|nr:Na/Pi cotransporter family protein [Malonomonas rubra]
MAWAEMWIGVFGGLALFLFGMERMADGLKATTGSKMQNILGHLTSNRLSGVTVGALLTAVIQSSSVTTVLVVGFVSAGLMSLSQSIGVIMGANIGTTITGQIVAFKVTKLALAFVAVGFSMVFAARQERLKHYGGILLGLGLIFFGMNVMSESMYPLRSYAPFLEVMQRMENPLLGILAGAFFTALIQSSSASIGIVIVMASQGFVSLPAGISLALGADIGTCVTALLASLGKPRIAVRAAVFHVIFNVVGVVIWVGFIDQLGQLTAWVSPHRVDLSGIARLAAETPRQIANANMLFKVTNTLLFIGFTPQLAKLVSWLVAEPEPAAVQPIVVPKYLESQLLDTPSAALRLVRMELGHLGQRILLMMAMSRQALERRDVELFREMEKADDAADILHSEIVNYLNLVGKRKLTNKEADEFYQMSQAADTLEGIGDVLETDLCELGLKMVERDLHPSETTLMILQTLHEEVYLALEAAIRAIVDDDQRAAQEVISLRSAVNQVVEAAFLRKSESLAASGVERLEILQIEFEVTDKLKRIYSLCKRIARLYVPKEV